MWKWKTKMEAIVIRLINYWFILDEFKYSNEIKYNKLDFNNIFVRVWW